MAPRKTTKQIQSQPKVTTKVSGQRQSTTHPNPSPASCNSTLSANVSPKASTTAPRNQERRTRSANKILPMALPPLQKLLQHHRSQTLPSSPASGCPTSPHASTRHCLLLDFEAETSRAPRTCSG